jgi:hypothetical protein
MESSPPPRGRLWGGTVSVILYPAPRRPPSPNGQPQPPTDNWAARSLSPGKRQPTRGLVKIFCILVLLGQERPLAHSATPPPPSTPKSPSPDPGAILQGDMGGEDTLPRGASRRRKHPCSLRGPKCLCNVSSVVLYSGWVRAGPTCPGTRGRVRVCVPSDASRHQAENNGPLFKDI